MNVIEHGLTEGLQQGDGQPELPAFGEHVSDGEHHAVVKDIPTDGFAEGALLRVH